MFLEKDEAVFDCFPGPDFRNLVITAIVPTAATQNTGEAHDKALCNSVFEYGINHVAGACGMVETTASEKRGKQSLVEIYWYEK
jgi:hypothetical protein